MFLYKNQFLLIFSFLSIPIELWVSTAAIFRQSAGYVFSSKRSIVKLDWNLNYACYNADLWKTSSDIFPVHVSGSFPLSLIADKNIFFKL